MIKVAHSINTNPREAADELRSQLGDCAPSLLVCFASTSQEPHELLRQLHHLGTRRAREEEIDEPGTGDFGLDHTSRFRQCGNDGLCQLAWIAAQTARQLHCHVAGIVAVGGLLGALNDESQVGQVRCNRRQRGLYQCEKMGLGVLEVGHARDCFAKQENNREL